MSVMDRNYMLGPWRAPRARRAVLSVAFSCLVAASAPSAFAAGGKESTVKGEKGQGGGAAAASSASGEGSAEPGETNRDRAAERPVSSRKWEVGAGFETHRLFIQNDLQGVGADKLFNYFQANASWLPTENDSVAVYFGAYQRFIADPGETGFRLDDVAIRYSHYFELPARTQLAARAAVFLPTSFVSHKQGSLGAGRLSLALDKPFGKYVAASVRVNGTGFLQRYDSPEGGGLANPLASLSGSAGVRVRMPFHTPLLVGLEAYTGYTWFLRAQGQPVSTFYGAAADPQYSQQPVLQSYGGEVYLGYELPEVGGMKADLHLAVAEGDPALGYMSLLHDGVSHTYLYWRESSELYGALSLRY